jgi:hypothetical protein
MPLYPTGAVYKVSPDVVKFAVTFLKILIAMFDYPSSANMYGVITAKRDLSNVSPVMVPVEPLIVS